jgi:hypothetical protein
MCAAPKGHPNYATEDLGGRPKKYDDTFIEKEADKLEEWMKKRENIFLEDFAFERGYSYRRLNEWSKENQRFADTYERFQMRQKSILFKGGLGKKFNYNMCALILGHSHGVFVKTESKISGDAVNPLAFILKSVDGSSKELVNDK